jgi:Peptidase family M28
VNARLYRGTWLLVGFPLLVAAFTVTRATPLPPPALPPNFDETTAATVAEQLAGLRPNRVPGSPESLAAATWVADQFEQYGFEPETQRFTRTIPGLGRVELRNLVAIAQGGSDQKIVVMAHRDGTGIGRGANDNASGTAALIELARGYARLGASGGRRPRDLRVANTIVFLSTDGGAFGGVGADEFVRNSPYAQDVVAVLNLDAIGGAGPPHLQLAGDEPRSPARALVETAAVRVLEQTGRRPERPSAFRQLIDLGFPFSFYEHGPFVARGIPAITLTSSGDRPPPSFGDEQVVSARLGQIGRSAQGTLGSLDQGLELARGTASYVYLGPRIIRGWAIKLVLVAALLPFLVAAVDLFARCRRRHISLVPAVRSFRRRLGFWAFVGLLFAAFSLVGVWANEPARPLSPELSAATEWPWAALGVFGVVTALAWLAARDRLLPRRDIAPAEELAGYTVALLALAVIALLVVGANPFALLFLLPSLHAWLWLPHVRDRSVWLRAGVLLAGFSGPLVLLWSFGTRFELGLDAPWYLASLVAVGYVPLQMCVITLAWAAAAGQLAALATGRYAPYASERGDRPGIARRLVRSVVLGARARRADAADRRRALPS